MIFNHIKTREKKESSKTDKTNYEISINIRLEVGRELHSDIIQMELHLFIETVLSTFSCFLFSFFVCNLKCNWPVFPISVVSCK